MGQRIASGQTISLDLGDRFSEGGVDAELLARLGRVDPSLLEPIVHRGEASG
jgi:hypothetical protein